MNRSDRRKQARQDKHKRPVVIKKMGDNDSYNKGYNDAVSKESRRIMKMLFGACAIALHDRHGFGKERILRTLYRMQEICDEMLTSEELAARCYRETGVEITVLNDGITEITTFTEDI